MKNVAAATLFLAAALVQANTRGHRDLRASLVSGAPTALRAADVPPPDVPTRIPTAIWIGTKDQLVPLQVVRDSRDVLRARGFPIAQTDIKGHTHSYAERGEEVTAQAWQFFPESVAPA